MRNNVETSTVGEILFEEFMKPNNISAYKLAKEMFQYQAYRILFIIVAR